MVDISMEILASSVPLRNGYMARYRVKSWWAHIDVPPDVTYIKLPRLPMIQPFLIMTGKDTTIFVETWQDHKNAVPGSGDGGMPSNKTNFLGMTTCTVDEQLKTPNLNPSVQWLDVHDPIEDTSRGKLLVKIDAKFVLPEETTGTNNRVSSPSRSANRYSFHGAGSHNDSPVKMIQSPRSSLGPNFLFDYNNSPVMQHVSSRKSDTSVFSIRSASSTRSQEQAVQTDLCLPVFPEMHKYTAALNSKLSSAKQNGRSTSEEISTSSTNTAGTTIHTLRDPLKLAEEILIKKLPKKDNAQTPPRIRQSELGSHSNSSQGTASKSTEFRRSCLVKQHIQQQDPYRSPEHPPKDRVHLERKTSKNCNMDSLEDIIDMLNRDSVDSDGVFDSPTEKTQSQQQLSTKGSKNSKVISSDSGKPPHPLPRSSTGSAAGPKKLTLDVGKSSSGGNTGALKRESIYSALTSANQFRGHGRSSPVYNATDKVREGYDDNDPEFHHQPGRFKEIHFDGARARQQATSILMTRTTAEPTSQAPVVTRRRICAATFND